MCFGRNSVHMTMLKMLAQNSLIRVAGIVPTCSPLIATPNGNVCALDLSIRPTLDDSQMVHLNRTSCRHPLRPHHHDQRQAVACNPPSPGPLLRHFSNRWLSVCAEWDLSSPARIGRRELSAPLPINTLAPGGNRSPTGVPGYPWAG